MLRAPSLCVYILDVRLKEVIHRCAESLQLRILVEHPLVVLAFHKIQSLRLVGQLVGIVGFLPVVKLVVLSVAYEYGTVGSQLRQDIPVSYTHLDVYKRQTQAPADTAAAEGGASGDAAASGDYEEIELVFSHINAETHTWHKMAEKFKELIEERSGGKITVTIYPNNQLGSEIETVQSAIAGMGDCDIVLTGESMQTYVEELGIIGMPYAITSDEHMDAVLEGDVGKELEDLMLQAGLRSLGAVKRGPRYITSNKEIHTPADLQGFIIRTPESKMTMAAFEAMGAKPTPMAFSEIFTSLQQGVIHGQENPLANIYDASLYEVQDYIIGTEHLRAWVYMAISEARFSSFSEACLLYTSRCV